MKGIAGLGAVAAVALLGLAGRDVARSPSRPKDDRLAIVTGNDRPRRFPAAPAPVAGRPVADPAPAPSSPTAGVTVPRSDAAALAALFDAQQRDPAWAPGVEAAVGSHLPAGSDVRCAAFLCRIAMPAPDRSMAASADEQADRASRGWTAYLAYNRLTATFLYSGPMPTLIFYASRPAVDGPDPGRTLPERD